MHSRVCPACSKRHAQLISPSCPICQGSGVVTLGPAALAIHEPATVSLAVGIAIEANARHIDLGSTLSDDRVAPLRSLMSLLVDSGIITTPTTRRGAARRLRTVKPSEDPAEVAAHYTDADVEPLDEILATAAPYVYAETERPNVRGLPCLSAAGHPSHLARLADPMAVGTNTMTVARERGAQARAGSILFDAAPAAVAIRRRKKDRPA